MQASMSVNYPVIIFSTVDATDEDSFESGA